MQLEHDLHVMSNSMEITGSDGGNAQNLKQSKAQLGLCKSEFKRFKLLLRKVATKRRKDGTKALSPNRLVDFERRRSEMATAINQLEVQLISKQRELETTEDGELSHTLHSRVEAYWDDTAKAQNHTLLLAEEALGVAQESREIARTCVETMGANTALMHRINAAASDLSEEYDEAEELIDEITGCDCFCCVLPCRRRRKPPPWRRPRVRSFHDIRRDGGLIDRSRASTSATGEL